ncbi:MAG: ABC transporter permease [Deltaproteobacteria bacterium]|nr:ABC transporter permease [Deltaproteobacteria bacterium]
MSESYTHVVWQQFRKSRLAVVCLVFILLMGATAICAPFLANDHALLFSPPIPFGPADHDLEHVLEGPSALHLLGTDGDGRDVAAQLIWGSRVSLSVGFLAVGLAVLIGIFVGCLAGYYGGIIDIILSRLIEVMICFPTFFLILAILAFVGPSIYNIMIAIGLTGWTGVARLVRGEMLKLRTREFVTAARIVGASDRYLIIRHLLPHALTPVLVSATFGVASAILVEASLSFLGFGVPPQTPSWGSLLSSAQEFVDSAPWLTLAPGFAIFLCVTAYNIVGERLRDAIDPRMKT